MLSESIPLETQKPHDSDVIYKIMCLVRSERIIINMLHDEMLIGTYSLPSLSDVDIDQNHSIDATGKFAIRLNGNALRSITTKVDMSGNFIFLVAKSGKSITIAHSSKISLAAQKDFVLTDSKIIALLCIGEEKWIEVLNDYVVPSVETFYTSDGAMFVCRPRKKRGKLEQLVVQPQ